MTKLVATILCFTTFALSVFGQRPQLTRQDATRHLNSVVDNDHYHSSAAAAATPFLRHNNNNNNRVLQQQQQQQQDTEDADTDIATTCPPPGFKTASNIDALEYIALPWYSIKQTPVVYQPIKSLYCVQATYSMKAPSSTSNIFCKMLGNCDQRRISVYNQAREGSVDGKQIDATLQGMFPSDVDDSRLRVGPTWLNGMFYGDYYIIAAGKNSDFSTTTTIGAAEAVAAAEETTETTTTNEAEAATTTTENAYDWAIISGGPPNNRSNGACLPGKGRYNLDGFWLFSRSRNPPAQVVQGMEDLAASLGFDVSALIPVEQEGC